jgi:hypothetical protein
VPADEIAKRVDSFTTKAATAYAAVITFPDDEANRLLTTGPDDKANMAAMQRDIELWKKVECPTHALQADAYCSIFSTTRKRAFPLIMRS